MRILVVESDFEICQSVATMLQEEGFRVQTNDGDDAEDMGKLYEHDAIVLGDLGGPDGHHVLKHWRTAKVRAPVVMLSRFAGPEYAVRALGLGADDYMTKPFHRDELIARIHAVVRRTRGHAVSKIDAGPLTLNLDTREAAVHGAPLHLTGKEYHILECLMLRKGHEQTKEQIMTALYGGRDEPEIKIIDVLICKLRRKLERGGASRDMIETVWGRGYRIRNAAPPDLGEVGTIGEAYGGGINAGLMVEERILMRSPPLAPAD